MTIRTLYLFGLEKIGFFDSVHWVSLLSKLKRKRSFLAVPTMYRNLITVAILLLYATEIICESDPSPPPQAAQRLETMSLSADGGGSANETGTLTLCPCLPSVHHNGPMEHGTGWGWVAHPVSEVIVNIERAVAYAQADIYRRTFFILFGTRKQLSVERCCRFSAE